MAVNMTLLKLYAQKGYNVLFSASHGVGKTAITKAVFDEVFGEMGKKWLYFSAATLDPWVDLVGVPHSGKTPDGQPLLELLRPQWVYEEIEGIFFDEINRAPDKVRNALMELIQFKSINGFKMSKLKSIWAAENPWDEESTYSVNKLDPAQKDRFQIQIELENKPDTVYFRGKYPVLGPKFLEWWTALSADNKKLVSPRRLEDAILVYQDGGDLKQVLPAATNVAALVEIINKEAILKQIQDVLALPADQLKARLTVDFVTKMHAHFSKVPMAQEKIYEHIPAEVVSSLKNKQIAKGIEKWQQEKAAARALAERVAQAKAAGKSAVSVQFETAPEWAVMRELLKKNSDHYPSQPDANYLAPWRTTMANYFSSVSAISGFVKKMDSEVALKIAQTLLAWHINLPFSHAGPSYKFSQKLSIHFVLNVHRRLGIDLTESQKTLLKKRMYATVEELRSDKTMSAYLPALNKVLPDGSKPVAVSQDVADTGATDAYVADAKKKAQATKGVKYKGSSSNIWSSAIQDALAEEDDEYGYDGK